MRNKKLGARLGIHVDRCIICNKQFAESLSPSIPTRFHRYLGTLMKMRDGKILLVCKKCYPEHFEYIGPTWNPKYTPGYCKAKTVLGETILAQHNESKSKGMCGHLS